VPEGVRLGGLDAAASAELPGRWGIAVDRADLAARVGGHALSLAVTGSYVGAVLGGDAAGLDAVDPAAAAPDDALARRLQAVLAAYAEALAPLERDLLARLALFPAGAERAALLGLAAAHADVAGALAGRRAADVDRALARLARLGLATRGAAARWASHPFVADCFRGLLEVAPARVHAVERDRLAADLPGLTGRPGARPRDPEALDRVERLLAHTLAAGDARAAFGVYEAGLGGFAHLGLALGDMARGERVVRRFAAGGPEALRSDLPALARASLAYDWALYAGALGDLDRGVAALEAHAAAVEDALAPPEAAPHLAMSRRTLAYVRRLQGELRPARAAAAASLAAARPLEARAADLAARLTGPE